MKMASEDEIDELAIAQADDDSAWEAPIEVKRNKSAIDVQDLFAKIEPKTFSVE